MKSFLVGSMFAFFLHPVGAVSAFGPSGCVSLEKSSLRTCVFRTNCRGHDISKFEFAFDCSTGLAGDAVGRHSFGIGVLDDVEVLDTGIRCNQCVEPGAPSLRKSTLVHVIARSDAVEPAHTSSKNLPLPVPMVDKRVAVYAARFVAPTVKLLNRTERSLWENHATQGGSSISKEHSKTGVSRTPVKMVHALVSSNAIYGVAQTMSKTEVWPFSSAIPDSAPTSKVARYGPDECVATYRNNEGHCVMQTLCGDFSRTNPSRFAEYDFGLICVDAKGVPVRHVFGKTSFKPEETFDTLIECEKCIGLEDMGHSLRLSGSVAVLVNQVKSMSGEMRDLAASVQKLTQKVFPASPPAAKNESSAQAAQTGQEQNAESGQASAVKAQPVSQQLSQHHSRQRHTNGRRHRRGHRHRHVTKVMRNDQEEAESASSRVTPTKHLRLRHRHLSKRPAHSRGLEAELAAAAKGRQEMDEAGLEAEGAFEEEDINDVEEELQGEDSADEVGMSEEEAEASDEPVVVSHKGRGRQARYSQHHAQYDGLEDEIETEDIDRNDGSYYSAAYH